MGLALTISINKNIIKKFVKNATYSSDINSKAKFKVMNGTAVYDNKPLVQLDYDEMTCSLYSGVVGFAKQMQTMIKTEALNNGFSIVEE